MRNCIWSVAAVGFGLCAPARADQLAFVDDFTQLNPGWQVADYDFDNLAFDTDWRRAQVKVGQGLILALDPQKGAANHFVGASIRRDVPSRFGCYEITMQAAKGAGLVTGFFTYTGPHYGTRHDEIDIEILGRNTGRLHAAWYVDGKLAEKYIPLGFDASRAPHRYAFEWQRDRLRWFVDGRMIFERKASQGNIPVVPGYLFANLWAADPSIAGWAGRARRGTRAQTHVSQIQFLPSAQQPGDS